MVLSDMLYSDIIDSFKLYVIWVIVVIALSDMLWCDIIDCIYWYVGIDIIKWYVVEGL